VKEQSIQEPSQRVASAGELVPWSPGYPVSWSASLPRFLAIVAQLALILLIISLYRIEPNRPFFAVMYLAAGGFVIHTWLPWSWRPAFFALLSLAAALLILGWPSGVWLIGIGAGLIVVCRLPLPVGYRAMFLLVIGLALFVGRVRFSDPFWPILGSMFMFRLIVYLYDTRHERRAPPLSPTLAYFFPLPNLCFPLFPVLDFKTFRETYYDREPYTIYQSGVAWIVRGLTHLLAYRLIKYYLYPAPHELRDLPHVVLFLAANYALYLRISGWFHIITGVLHLYGFNLPRTHHNYFLASSVSDIWRRINIYWKDFMTKVFFYPAFFTVRGWGMPTRLALVAAGLWVFGVTWLLHSYQVFWLSAKLPLNGHEALLWLAAGVAVVISLQFDLRRTRKAAEAPTPAPGEGWIRAEAVTGAILTLKIVGTFFLVSLFWACWTLPIFPSYLRVLAASGELTGADSLALLGCLAGVVALGAMGRVAWLWFSRGGVRPLPSYVLPAVPTAVLLVLVVAGNREVGEALGPEVAGVLRTLRLEASTPVEAAISVQGYYDQLADTPLQVSPLLELPGLRRQQESSRTYADMSRPTNDFLERELIPGWSGEIGGRHLTVNGLGLRDRKNLTREKPDGVCRIVVVGSSVVMGWGVGDQETFTRLLEADLAGERPKANVEVLNFGTGKSYAIHRRYLIERKVLDFNPDAIFYVAHQDEFLGPVRHLALLLANRHELPAYLQEVAREAGVTPKMAQGEMEVRLERFAPKIVQGVYADIVATCRKRGILPVWVYIPMLGVEEGGAGKAMAGLAETAGFQVVNLSGWEGRHATEQLMADRHHANARGHQLIAERLAEALGQRPQALPACLRR